MGNESTWERGFICADAVGRASKGQVIFRDGAVNLACPSPGTAVFGPDDIEQLAQLTLALTEGIDALREEYRKRRTSSDEQRGRSA